jgi:C-terminal processing protease CtpA/Prc
MIPAPANLNYSGPVAVLVGTGCISACEFFSWDMTRSHRAAIVGQYGTAGGGGGVEIFEMPGAIQVQFTIERGLTPSGQIKLEGKGVVPTVKVPVNLNTIQRDYAGDDVVLDAGVNYLESLP